MIKSKTQLSVSAIKNGTVIDHIPADSLFDVIQILDLNKLDQRMSFGTNMESKKLGQKAIIKLSKVFFDESDLNRIALVAPQAKLNIIKDYKVVEKRIVEIPDEIESIAKCVNPKCITNNENVKTRFYVVSKEKIALKSHYCEKITDKENLVIL